MEIMAQMVGGGLMQLNDSSMLALFQEILIRCILYHRR